MYVGIGFSSNLFILFEKNLKNGGESPFSCSKPWFGTESVASSPEKITMSVNLPHLPKSFILVEIIYKYGEIQEFSGFGYGYTHYHLVV